MIAELLAVKGCLLAIYYCPDEVYRLSIIDIDEATPRRRKTQGNAPHRDGRVLEFDDIFFSIKMATDGWSRPRATLWQHQRCWAKSIVRVLTR